MSMKQMEKALERDLREIKNDKYEGFCCPDQTCIVSENKCWHGTPNEDQNGNLWMPNGYPECYNCGKECIYRKVLFSYKFKQS